MSRKSKAVVLRETGGQLAVEEVTVESPRSGEIMVKLAACGVCHSDLSVTNGTIPLPPPVVLGHEGAGVVVEVGEGVRDFAVGDHVVSSFTYACGQCRFCLIGRPVLCVDRDKVNVTMVDGSYRFADAKGAPLGAMCGCGVMSEYATLSVHSAVKIDSSIPLDRAALVGCAVTTGVGAALNTAKVEPGSSAVVFGAGGVGLNVIQGCAVAGAARIIAVDMSESKLELAKAFGATDTILTKAGEDHTKAIKKLTDGGADYAFECIGYGEVAALAYKAIRRGGLAVVVGVAKPSDNLSIRTMSLPFEEKTLTGSYFGSCVPKVDFPRLLGLYKGHKLKLDELIRRRYGIDEAPRAFADLAAGGDGRGVIIF
ncbi:MAG TPA: Zn-dependent alcohol dehydrogenase [Burkholderiales bacterium]|nr:Zn-dependent alcohol dehydrogenase [Burkholderiales bacterium]